MRMLSVVRQRRGWHKEGLERPLEEGIRLVDLQILALDIELLQRGTDFGLIEREHLSYLAHNALGIRIEAGDQTARAWCRMIGETEPNGRGFQRIEGLRQDAGDDLRAHPETDKSGVDGDQPAGLADRGNDWRDVERTQNAHIDNFGRAADLVQNVSRAHCLKDTVRRCDDGDVFAFADYARTIERILVVALGH